MSTANTATVNGTITLHPLEEPLLVRDAGLDENVQEARPKDQPELRISIEPGSFNDALSTILEIGTKRAGIAARMREAVLARDFERVFQCAAEYVGIQTEVGVTFGSACN